MDPAKLPPFLTVRSDGITLAIKLQPRAATNAILPPEANSMELRVRVTAPPVDAKANEALLRCLSEWLDCPRGAAHLLRGQTARHKVVLVRGISAAAVLERLPQA